MPHASEHPSPPARLPSSHSSPDSRMPLPHTGKASERQPGRLRSAQLMKPQISCCGSPTFSCGSCAGLLGSSAAWLSKKA
eukprot:scaffold162168_cov25-Tisochrysis_lutea.AAC.5